MFNLNRSIVEKTLLAIFLVSWLDIPRIFYDKYSLDFMTAWHGKNLFPFFAYILPIFLVYIFLRAEKNKSFDRPFLELVKTSYKNFKLEDRLFIYLFSYLIFTEAISWFTTSQFSLRMIVPLFFGHAYLYLYRNFKNVSIVNNIDSYFTKVVITLSILVFIFQILMFFGIVPGLANEYSNEQLYKILHFIRVDGLHIGLTSYIATIALYIVLFRSQIINSLFCYFSLLVISLVLIINQTRGAIIIAILIFFAFLIRQLKKAFSYWTIGVFVIFLITITITIILAHDILDHRIFNYSDSSAMARVDLILKTFDVFRDNPLLGYGQHFGEHLRFGHENQLVHSYLMRFLVAYGVLGFIFLSLYYKSIFLGKPTYINFVGLGVVFSISLFEPYFIWATYLIAASADKKK